MPYGQETSDSLENPTFFRIRANTYAYDNTFPINIGCSPNIFVLIENKHLPFLVNLVKAGFQSFIKRFNGGRSKVTVLNE